MTTFTFVPWRDPVLPSFEVMGTLRDRTLAADIHLHMETRELVATIDDRPVPVDREVIVRPLYAAIDETLDRALGHPWWQRMREITGIEERAFRADRFERNLLPPKVLLGIRRIAVLATKKHDPVIIGAAMLAWSAANRRLIEARQELGPRTGSMTDALDDTRHLFLDMIR